MRKTKQQTIEELEAQNEQLREQNNELIVASDVSTTQLLSTDQLQAADVGSKLTTSLAGTVLQSMDRGVEALVAQIQFGSAQAEQRIKSLMTQTVFNQLIVTHAEYRKAVEMTSTIAIFGAKAKFKLTRDQLREQMLCIEADETSVDAVMAEIDQQFDIV